ncbi:MAG: hypothetical protein JSS09_00680 [Verrucomicrobia bacterium]|nr:hypothetical protein [Verrucomicrobiota bacterium]
MHSLSNTQGPSTNPFALGPSKIEENSQNELFPDVQQTLPTMQPTEKKVYWLFYSRSNRDQKETAVRNLMIFSPPLALYTWKFGISNSFLFHAFVAFLAMNIFGTCHTEVQVGDLKKNNTEIKPALGPNPETGEYDKGFPHLAIEIKTSQAEFRSLQSSIRKELPGAGCAAKAVSYIENTLKEKLIPYPISLSPLFSTLYLLASKCFKNNKRVGEVDIRIKNKELRQLFSVSMVYEFFLCIVILPSILGESLKNYIPKKV